MALKQGPWFPATWQCSVCFFYLVLMGGEESALLLRLRDFVALFLQVDGWGFEQEPHCTQGK